MRHLRSLVPTFLVLWAMAAQADAPLLRLAGSNTVGASLGPALVEGWLAQRGVTSIGRVESGPNLITITGREKSGASVSVVVEARGSGTAFSSLGKGAADVGMASRAITPEESARLTGLGDMASLEAEYVLGLDGVAVVVNAANPVASLDRLTLARIFSGEAKDWSQVGGSAGPIHVYARDENSGTFDTFRALVFGERHMAPGSRRFESSVALSDAVAADPAGIGFVGLPYVRNTRVLAVADKGIRPLKPDAVTVATEDYALSRRLFLYVPPKGANAPARDFAAFAVSPQGQAIVAREGFVSQEVNAVEATLPDDAPAEYKELIKGAHRLSINFRFLAGAAYPDTKARRDVERLSAFMQRPANEGKELILCGFSDGRETGLNALNLSIERADQITDLLLRARTHPRITRGFGASLPVASDETAAGRDRNRRVEVWIR